MVRQYSAEDIRGASEDYSNDIRERYLQLPPGTPSRIRELALSVTAGESNHFDRARKIEAFLGGSGEYRYTLDPPATPRGRNGVDFFLFDIKRGYCTYFSSAMAVLLRSIGIPSRVVGGFAPGPWSAMTRSVVLTIPHAWVEVYFPGQGWVEFEPTAGGPAQPSCTCSGKASGLKKKIPTETQILVHPSDFRRDEKPLVAGTVRTLDGKPAGKAEVVLYLTDKDKKQGIRIGQGVIDEANLAGASLLEVDAGLAAAHEVRHDVAAHVVIGRRQLAIRLDGLDEGVRVEDVVAHRREDLVGRIGETLGRLGLERRTFDEPMEQMSRGMQQKVAIARALLSRPALLLLDEPTTGLDPRSKREVQGFINELRKEFGTTILLTTHDMAEADELCDRIAILHRGRLVGCGTIDELRRQSGDHAVTLTQIFERHKIEVQIHTWTH